MNAQNEINAATFTALSHPTEGAIGEFFPAQTDASTGAILLVHEWYGLDSFARGKAEAYAKVGYDVLAVDIYKGKVTDDPNTAKGFMEEAFGAGDQVPTRVAAGIEALSKESGTAPSDIVMLGYSFGGAVTLNTAGAGQDLAGFIAFYGPVGAESSFEKGQIKAPLLAIFAGEDAVISQSDVATFKSALQGAEADATVHVVEGKQHSFANPNASDVAARSGFPFAYCPESDAETFQMTLDFISGLKA